MSCSQWLKLIAAYKAGSSSQAATDKAAQTEATATVLEQRAATDAEVARSTDAANREWLREHAKRLP